MSISEREKFIKAAIGDVIFLLRKHRKITQRELGKLVGVKLETISRYERGITRPSGDMLNKIEKSLCVIDGCLIDAAKTRLWNQGIIKSKGEVI